MCCVKAYANDTYIFILNLSRPELQIWNCLTAPPYQIKHAKTRFSITSLKFASPGFYILENRIIHTFPLFFPTASLLIPYYSVSSQQVPLAFPSKHIPSLTTSILITLVHSVVIIFPPAPCPNPFSSQKSGNLRKHEFWSLTFKTAVQVF